MTTKSYTIAKKDRTYIVSEADCPNARATGEYDSLREAQDAVLAVSGRVDLDWDYGEDKGADWWHTEWDVE